MPEIIYQNPAQNIEQGGESRHTIEVREGDEVIGSAEIDYFSKPIPVYQVTDLWTEPEHQGKGHASKVMEYIEQMLRKKGKAGVLVDAIDVDSPASGFYARRGWLPVPGSQGVHVYNLPAGVGPEVFQAYEYRQTPAEDRSEKSELKKRMFGAE